MIDIIIYQNFTIFYKVIEIEEKTSKRGKGEDTDEQQPKQTSRVVKNCIVLYATAIVSFVHFLLIK